VVLLGAALCGLAVHRHVEREALRSGGSPTLEPVRHRFGFPPRGLAAPRPPPAATAPLAPASRPGSAGSAGLPPPGPAAPAANRDLETLAVETFADARPALVTCLREERALQPDAAGKLPVTVVVDPAGLVASVALGSSPLRGPRFDECATLSLAALVFPAEIAGRELSITFDLR